MAFKVYSFSPKENKTITWAAASNSQSVQYTSTYGDPARLPNILRIFNGTDKVVCVVAGTGSAPTAATTDYAVGVNQTVEIDIGLNEYVAAIPVASATGSIYLARGFGGA